MANEETSEEEETSETSEDENKEEDDSEESEEESKESLKTDTDYEAELEKEKKRREAAEAKLEETRRKAKERYEKRHKEEHEEDEEDRPLTGSELRAILAEERAMTRKEMLSSRIEEVAKKYATSEAEAKLMVEIHKNRTFPDTLSLDEQMEEVYAIANRKKILAQNEELKRALTSKETKSKSMGRAGEFGQAASEPKMNSADLAIIKAGGFEWDATKRLYKKSLAGGKKYLFFDPKTKKRFVR